jgi:hypothetical protein
MFRNELRFKGTPLRALEGLNSGFLLDVIPTSQGNAYAEQIRSLFPSPKRRDEPAPSFGHNDVGEVFLLRMTAQVSYTKLASFFSKLSRLPAMVSLKDLNVDRDKGGNPIVLVVLEIPS